MRLPRYALILVCHLLFAEATLGDTPASITGMVIGDDGLPVGGATVHVEPRAGERPCAARTAADGAFSLRCDVSGRHVVRASCDGRIPWEIGDVELGPERTVYLNFMLRSAAGSAAAEPRPEHGAHATAFWTRPLPNPVLLTWNGRALYLRHLAIGVAAVSFVLGTLTMLAVGRHVGVGVRRLSAEEVGDQVLNPPMPGPGERVQPIATIGARGTSATVAFGADEIAAALHARRYGLVLASLVIAPLLFASFAAALAVAMLVGQEHYLFAMSLLVPAGFVLTAAIIGVQGIRRSRR